MNNQIDVAQWPQFDQKRLSRFGTGIPFSVLTPPSLMPQPTRGALSKPSLSIYDSVEFQTIFMK
jgi:hypothetical protein